MSIDDEALARLRSLLAKATPGPWQEKNEHEWDEIIGDIDGPDAGAFHYTHVCSVDMNDLRTPEQFANAALIVAMRKDIEALLDIAEAVARAPAGVVQADDGDLMMVRLPDDDRPSMSGQRVRLIVEAQP